MLRIALSAIFQRYVPADNFAILFGNREPVFWAINGRDNWCTALFVRRGYYSFSYGLARSWNSSGFRLLDSIVTGPATKSQIWSCQNCIGYQALYILSGICHALCSLKRVYCELYVLIKELVFIRFDKRLLLIFYWLKG